MSATSSSPADSGPLDDVARRLLAAASAEGVPLRLLGGVGIRLLLGDRLHPSLRRDVADLDFITTRRAGAAVERLIAAHGWEPRRRFNAVHGAHRLLFDETAGGERHIDVFVGGFRMCHQLPLLERLEERPETLPATDLLLTKLQIVTLNDKDRRDLYALLLGCPVGADNEAGTASGEIRPPAIEASRVAALAAADWGLCHTIELNLGRLRDGLRAGALDAEARERIGVQLDALDGAIQAAPKSRAWRLRARVGERRRWYEDPEEVTR
ncbi:MAG TPA: hypothetical protein VMU32_01970 [Solirubrobacteraceae bacterium]|nr:hypothetical protein [Solirubrobacteraceae bacterium]